MDWERGVEIAFICNNITDDKKVILAITHIQDYETRGWDKIMSTRRR